MLGGAGRSGGDCSWLVMYEKRIKEKKSLVSLSPDTLPNLGHGSRALPRASLEDKTPSHKTHIFPGSWYLVLDLVPGAM